MNFRPVVLFMLLMIVLIHDTEGLFIKGKILAAKKPFLLAKASVAKEVALSTKNAAVKTAEAAKATAIAVKTIALAPLKVAKKTIGIKVAALKAAKGLKVAALNKLLQAHPSTFGGTNLVLPAGGVAVLPINNVATFNLSLTSNPLHHGISEVSHPLKPHLGEALAEGISDLTSSLHNFASNSKPSISSSLTGQHVFSVRPLYGFIPHFNYNQDSYTPNVQLGVLPQNSITISRPHQSYGVPLK